MKEQSIWSFNGYKWLQDEDSMIGTAMNAMLEFIVQTELWILNVVPLMARFERWTQDYDEQKSLDEGLNSLS